MNLRHRFALWTRTSTGLKGYPYGRYRRWLGNWRLECGVGRNDAGIPHVGRDSCRRGLVVSEMQMRSKVVCPHRLLGVLSMPVHS